MVSWIFQHILKDKASSPRCSPIQCILSVPYKLIYKGITTYGPCFNISPSYMARKYQDSFQHLLYGHTIKGCSCSCKQNLFIGIVGQKRELFAKYIVTNIQINIFYQVVFFVETHKYTGYGIL